MKLKSIRVLISVLTAIIMAVPIVFVIGFSMGVDTHIWAKLWENRIPKLFVNSVLLVITVTLGTIILGTLLAFFVERTNIPGRKILKPLLVAPLITPCYIIAICYINFFGIKGLGEKALGSMGLTCSLPNIYGFWGAAGILIIGTYPYVYTIVAAALSRMDPRYSEVGRSLGVSRTSRFFRISLPLLMPAISAGGILVALYVLSDFGVVSLLRYKTFVNTIYEQMSGRYDYSIAASLSTILIGITVMLFLAQEYISKKREYASVQNKSYRLPLIDLKWMRYPALGFSLIILFFGLFLPVGILIYWFLQSFQTNEVLSVWQSGFSELLRSGMNSLFISSLAATAAVLLSLPLAYWAVRNKKSRMAKGMSWMSQSGIALPGVLIALGLSLVLSMYAPKLNFSVFALFMAFLVHFFAQSYQSTSAGLAQISPRLEEGARLLGCTPFRAFITVVRPLLTPAILTAWILVFLSSMRELPASLLLRPAGFDPLTVKVWIAASEGFYEQAAAPALLVVFLSLPLVIIISKNQDKFQSALESN